MVRNVTQDMRVRTRRLLRNAFASDILFSVCGGIYDRGEKSKQYHEKEFYRKILEITFKCASQVQGIEERYYGKG